MPVRGRVSCSSTGQHDLPVAALRSLACGPQRLSIMRSRAHHPDALGPLGLSAHVRQHVGARNRCPRSDPPGSTTRPPAPAAPEAGAPPPRTPPTPPQPDRAQTRRPTRGRPAVRKPEPRHRPAAAATSPGSPPPAEPPLWPRQTPIPPGKRPQKRLLRDLLRLRPRPRQHIRQPHHRPVVVPMEHLEPTGRPTADTSLRTVSILAQHHQPTRQEEATHPYDAHHPPHVYATTPAPAHPLPAAGFTDPWNCQPTRTIRAL